MLINITGWEQISLRCLFSYVEPYSFKDKFTMPKYIINAGSDEFVQQNSGEYIMNNFLRIN